MSKWGRVSGEIFNAVIDDTIENWVHHIDNKYWPIYLVGYNLGAQIGNKKLDLSTLK